LAVQTSRDRTGDHGDPIALHVGCERPFDVGGGVGFDAEPAANETLDREHGATADRRAS
jgi:hypothetical protein